MVQRHAAIDIGAGSGRVFVGWLENGKIVSREIHRFSTSDMFFLDRRNLNVYRFYEETVKALSLCAAE